VLIATRADGVLRHLRLVGSTAARARRETSHRGFRIVVLARQHAGASIVVHATLLGGPDRIARRFAFHADADDALAACEDACAELITVVDHLCAVPRAGASRDAR
jgi:hypothetical protein